MTYDYQAKRIIAILSDELPSGLAMNALGHLAFSAGHYSPNELMGQKEIVDADRNPHCGISKYPFIVLKAPKNEIKHIVQKAKEEKIFVVDYPQEMFDTGPDSELVAALTQSKEPTILYHAAVLVGETSSLKRLTGHLKLYR